MTAGPVFAERDTLALAIGRAVAPMLALDPSGSAALLAALSFLSLTGRPLRYGGHGRVGLVQRPGRPGGSVTLLGRQRQAMDERPGQRQGDGQQDPRPQPPGEK